MPTAELHGAVASEPGVGDTMRMWFLTQHFSMRHSSSWRTLACAIAFFIFCALPALGQSLACSEFYLSNGLRVILSHRPGCGAIHAALFINAKTGLSMRHSQEAMSLLLEAWSLQSGFPDATELWAKAGPSGIGHGRDLPADNLQAWCQAEYARIDSAIEAQHFEMAKSRLAARMKEPSSLAELFSLAINGNGAKPLGQSGLDTIANFSLSDIQALAWELAAAERVTIFLVGDVEEPAARSALEGNFTLLPRSTVDVRPIAVQPLPDDDGNGAAEGHFDALPSETQKAEIQSESKTEALMAWHIPPSMGDEIPSLGLFAEIIAGSKYSELFAHLVEKLGCSTSVRASVETAGINAPILFVIQADVSDGHTLEEVEKALVDTMQKIGQDEFGYAEINRAANRMNTKYSRLLGNASGLAQALIDSQDSAGDWTPALNKATFGARLEAHALTHLLGPIFATGPNYAVLVKRDPISSPRTPDHARLIELLGNLYERKLLKDPDKERAFLDSLRQFGQMPFDMRKQLLNLLESEVAR